MNKSLKKKISAVLSLVMCISLLSGCTEKNTNTDTDTETKADTPTVITEVKEVDENAVDPNDTFDLDGGVTDKMYNRSLINEGNQARLKAAMKKAMNGESITVGVIGGSITQGSSSSSAQASYAGRFNTWWAEKFPDSEVKFVNAGIGGTDSYLGVHRVDKQLLDSNPDVVIVEFSVNDTEKLFNKYSYDSLVRKILNANSAPAVILLFTTQEDGTSLQDVHMEIGSAYNLPMLSYREAVYPEVAAGTINWKDISPDNIHPNDKGHEIIGQIVSRYLDSVYDNLDNISDDITFDTKAYTSDYYVNADFYGSSAVAATAMDGFETGTNNLYSQFPDNWVTSAGGTITFDVECQNFGVFFARTVDGKSGTYEVYVDGERKGKLEADFSGGWGNYGFAQRIVLGNEKGTHNIVIKPAEDSEDKALTILALMIS